MVSFNISLPVLQIKTVKMADEETIRRVVREEMMSVGRNSTSTNLYSATQRMIREASSSAISEATNLQNTSLQPQQQASTSGGARFHHGTNRPNIFLQPQQQASTDSSRFHISDLANTAPKPLMKSKPYRLKPYRKVPYPSNSKEKVKILEVVLLEEITDDAYDGVNDDKYKVSEDLILGTWMYDLIPNRSEREIRKDLKSLFSSKYPIISENDFEFLKYERTYVSIAPTANEWNTAHLKALIGQSKRLHCHCRLKYINSETLKLHDDDVDKDMQTTNNEQIPSTSKASAASISSHDYETLLESTNSFVNELLDKNQVPKFKSLAKTLAFLNSKVDQESSVRLSIDRSFLFDDAMAFYKGQSFDPEKVLKIRYQNEPAIDTGGVQRQFFTDLFEMLENGSNGLPPLFVGNPGHKLPTSDPSIAGSDLMFTVGKIIAHCIVQNGYGFGNLAQCVYRYIVYGEIDKAVSYITIEDINSIAVKKCVEKVCLSSISFE